MRRFKVPGFCRFMAWWDHRMHESRLHPKFGIICDVYDWSLGLSWREARS